MNRDKLANSLLRLNECWVYIYNICVILFNIMPSNHVANNKNGHVIQVIADIICVIVHEYVVHSPSFLFPQIFCYSVFECV